MEMDFVLSGLTNHLGKSNYVGIGNLMGGGEGLIESTYCNCRGVQIS